jgi:hypothetical protein
MKYVFVKILLTDVNKSLSIFFRYFIQVEMLTFSDFNSLFKNVLPFPVTLLILGKLDIVISLGAVLHIGLHCPI